MSSRAPTVVGFASEDEFNRKPVAEKIIRLLTSDIDVSPMVIDGGWGAGKTRFCEKTIRLLEERHPEYQCIYVDAFKADHADEPLMTLLAAVAEALPKSKQKQLIQKAIPAARFALKTSLKAGVGWVVRQNADKLADDFEKEIEEAGKAAADASIESLLKDHIDAKKSIKTLRDTLRRLASTQPIVVFVDELDRCRPDFAVSMLENIKHIFDVKGVSFVLVTNSSQLRSAIVNQYGGDMANAQRYLDKFIAFTFELPRHIRHTGNDSVLAAHIYLRTQLNKSRVFATDQIFGSTLAWEFADVLIRQNDITLREAETWARHLAIYHLLSSTSEFRPGVAQGRMALAVFVIFVFAFHKDLVRDIKRRKLDPPALARLVGRDRLSRSNNNDFVSDLVGVISVAARSTADPFDAFGSEDAEYWRVRAIQRFGDDFRDTSRRLPDFFAEIFDIFEFGEVS